MSSNATALISAGVSFATALIVISINTLLFSRKEQDQLRVICRILLAESEQNKILIAGLINKELLTKEFIKSQKMNTDWNSLKQESVFYRMDKHDFEKLITHYKEIAGLQRIIYKPQMSDGIITVTAIDDLPESFLQRLLRDCENVCAILAKYAKVKTKSNFQEKKQ